MLTYLPQVVKFIEKLGLDAIAVIGGDGTMSISNKLQELGVNIVGIPKTIDNDLMGTDRTFGFDSAVAIATEAIDRLHTTAQSHNRVMILETMGRYAGWIALYAGVAGGADVILIPEFEYEIEEIVPPSARNARVAVRNSPSLPLPKGVSLKEAPWSSRTWFQTARTLFDWEG